MLAVKVQYKRCHHLLNQTVPNSSPTQQANGGPGDLAVAKGFKNIVMAQLELLQGGWAREYRLRSGIAQAFNFNALTRSMPSSESTRMSKARQAAICRALTRPRPVNCLMSY